MRRLSGGVGGGRDKDVCLIVWLIAPVMFSDRHLGQT